MTDQSTYLPARIRTLRMGRSEWLHSWLEGETPDNTLLEQHGFQSHLYYAVVIFETRQETATSNQLSQLLHTEATRRMIHGPVVTFGNAAVLFHPVETPQQTTRLKWKTQEIRDQLALRLGGVELCCGVGRPARGMDALRDSFREAMEAVAVCGQMATVKQATFFGNSSLFGLLLATKSQVELHQFCEKWLSHLISYDEEQHSDLVETLKTYFSNNGNTALTAKELKIHRNTLAYRLNRIAEITCLDLDDADVRLNLHLALKAREVLNGRVH